MNSRRKFLQKGGAGLLAATLLPLTKNLASSSGNAYNYDQKSSEAFDISIAGYSFLNFKLDESLAMMKKVDVHYLCIKDFHLPYKSTDAEIAAFHQKLKDHGVTGYAVGPIYMKTHQEIDDAFIYAKRVGVKLMIGIPNIEDLPYISAKVKEFDIRYGIHNHGPQDKLYPNATVVYNHVKDLDPRVGLCFDMGHDTRDGQDPVADLKKYGSRIFEIHLKNVTAATNEGTTCELDRGVINIPAFIKMLRRIGYTGKCALEYEKDMKDPLAGIAESVGYYHGVVDGTR
ncbi:Sugar phosphate isomerase/epimerase [bacterium A37T11]|nr:Sugar phosphate isomerase/epimerase [bacterium A37T11]